MKSDTEIADSTVLEEIDTIARKAGIPVENLFHYGPYIAKVPLKLIDDHKAKKSHLILVTAITATKAGVGKTTVSIGLGMGLNHIGKKAIIALREPSLGPCFGIKGGATGGGYAQVLPPERINLHFTGDFHAITSAHNLIAAQLDNYIFQNRAEGSGLKNILWRRVMDMNDRSLRQIVTGLGGLNNGIPTEAGFDITPASEIMAILCLSKDMEDMEQRIGRIVVAHRYNGEPFTVNDLGITGPVLALLRDAIEPNLVQTTEHNPVLVHGGPFANIAHGCNSAIATRMALTFGDYVVTEAGFGADLGAEKFFNIKCRQSGLRPDLTVLVATTLSLKMHGVLYDSMKNHVEAWYRTLTPMGFKCSKDEFYLYEGRTGASTIKYLFDKHFGKQVSDDECAEIYKIKEKHFNALEKIVPMPGADLMLQRIIGNGIRPVLVTGSGQGSLLDRLDHDYPGVFEQQYKVTAYDVKIGKPSPEPYLMGLSKAGVKANEAIVIENAPLGVVSGTAAQIFTIAVNTGPIPAQALIEAGADMVFPSMPDFANHVDKLIHTLKITR